MIISQVSYRTNGPLVLEKIQEGNDQEKVQSETPTPKTEVGKKLN